MRILLASSRPAIAAALSSTISPHVGPIEVVASTAPLPSAPTILIVDTVQFPDAVSRISHWAPSWPATRILAMVSRPSDHIARRMREAGANAILSEMDQLADWLRVLRKIRTSHFCTGSSFTNAPKLLEVLTDRQAQVYDAIVLRGLSDEGIAEELNISAATAETHRRDLMRKLNVHRHERLLWHALRIGILDSSEIPDLSPHRQVTRRHAGCGA